MIPKKSIFILLVVFILSACKQEGKVSEALDISFFPDLVQKQGLYFEKGSDKPFTGSSGSTYSSGAPYVSASFVDGKIDGMYSAYYSNGEKMGESRYSEGVLDGLSEAWHENGTKASKITFINGQRQGKMTLYYSSGLINAEGFFNEGKLDSIYTRWNVNGEIEYIDLYDNGEFIRELPVDSL